MDLYLGGLFIGGLFTSEIWGVYFREGLLLEGLTIGILRHTPSAKMVAFMSFFRLNSNQPH